MSFTAEVEKQLLTLEKRYPQLTWFIREVLAQDPRPAYRKRARKRAKPMPSGCMILTFAGALPTQVLKSLRWNRVNFNALLF